LFGPDVWPVAEAQVGPGSIVFERWSLNGPPRRIPSSLRRRGWPHCSLQGDSGNNSRLRPLWYAWQRGSRDSARIVFTAFIVQGDCLALFAHPPHPDVTLWLVTLPQDHFTPPREICERIPRQIFPVSLAIRPAVSTCNYSTTESTTTRQSRVDYPLFFCTPPTFQQPKG
jgi:hypothetical protein